MQIYADKILRLEKKRINGKAHPFDIIKSKDAVAIIPLLENKIVLERQYRVAVGKELYEIPAGHIEKGEKPENAAKRELQEETGYVAKRVEHIFSAYSSPGYLTEKLYFYIATGLIKGKSHKDIDEVIKTKVMPIDDAIKLIKEKKIIDMKTIAGILFFKNFE